MPSPCSPNPLPTSHFHAYSLPSETPPLAETCSIAPHSCVVFTAYSKPSSLLQHTFPNSKAPFPTVLPVSRVQSLTLETLSHQQYPTQFQHPLSACNISFLPQETPLSQRLPFFSSSPDALPKALRLGRPLPTSNSFSPLLRSCLVSCFPVSKPSNHLECLPPAQPYPLAPGLQKLPLASITPVHTRAQNHPQLPPSPAFESTPIPRARARPRPSHCSRGGLSVSHRAWSTCTWTHPSPVPSVGAPSLPWRPPSGPQRPRSRGFWVAPAPAAVGGPKGRADFRQKNSPALSRTARWEL